MKTITLTEEELKILSAMVRHFEKHPSACLYDHDEQWPVVCSLREKIKVAQGPSQWTRTDERMPDDYNTPVMVRDVGTTGGGRRRVRCILRVGSWAMPETREFAEVIAGTEWRPVEK